MAKKYSGPTGRKRGRKGVLLGRDKNLANGRAFINVSFSTTTKGTSRKRAPIISKSAKNKGWYEIRTMSQTGSNLNARQLQAAQDLRSAYVQAKQGFRSNRKLANAETLKRAGQKFLHLTKGGSKSPYMKGGMPHRGNYQTNARMRPANVEKGIESGRAQYLRDFGGQRIFVTGVKNFDIHRAVRDFGRGVIPNKDIEVKNKKGIVIAKRRSIAKTGIWWVDTYKKRSDGTVYIERAVHPEILRRMTEKMDAKRIQKRDYRRSLDPLVGTRKRGRPPREVPTKYIPMFQRGFVPAEWAKQAHGITKAIGYNNGQAAWVKLRTVPPGIKSKIERIRQETIRGISAATLEAQVRLMRELEYYKDWNNVTGNAYTGIVSLAYVSSARLTYRKQTAQMPGVQGRKATRGKISKGQYKRYYKTANGKKTALKEKGAQVYIGRRFDNPSQYFFIDANKVDFQPTTGGYAYEEAKQALAAYNFNMPYKFSDGHSGVAAVLKVVSGAEYIDKLETKSGHPIMLIALQRAEEILQQKLKRYL